MKYDINIKNMLNYWIKLSTILYYNYFKYLKTFTKRIGETQEEIENISKNVREENNFLLTSFRGIFQGFCLTFRNTYFKEYPSLALFKLQISSTNILLELSPS